MGERAKQALQALRKLNRPPRFRDQNERSPESLPPQDSQQDQSDRQDLLNQPLRRQ